MFKPNKSITMFAAFGIAVALASAVAPSAQAATGTGAFSGDFTGTATLTSGFPCNGGPVQAPRQDPSPAITYGCTGGLFAGTVTGVLIDTDGDTTHCDGVIVICDINASFSYTEPCTGGAPADGAASGSFVVKVRSTGAEVIDGTFDWVRVGTTATITLEVDSDVDDTTGIHGDGAATAAFVPALTPGTCTAPVSPQLATVAGSAHATYTDTDG